MGDNKSGVQRFAPRFFELDRRGLVPHYVVLPEKADQHDHVDGIEGGIHAAAKDGADVVARAPGKRQIEMYLAPVFRDVLRSPTGSSIARKAIEGPAAEFIGEVGVEGHGCAIV